MSRDDISGFEQSGDSVVRISNGSSNLELSAENREPSR